MKSKMKIIYLILVILLIDLSGCKKDWLDEQPLTQISQSSFWKTESDALLALTGLYRVGILSMNVTWNLYMLSATDDTRFPLNTDAGVGKFELPNDGSVISLVWKSSTLAIYRSNVFLANIDNVVMDANKKAQYIAEARFMRANIYFWMLQFWGGVPLITKPLTIDEANHVTRNSRKEIVDFCLTEFTAATADLPASRIDAERGRILKGAALAQKGRLLMIEKRWPEAAAAFKEIIDLNVHIIDPRYKAIFEESGETSKEIIFAYNCIAGLWGNWRYQKNYHPAFYGGNEQYSAFQDLVDAFLMKDGLPIEESPLYDPANPFANRDPRLYVSLFLPEYTVFRGKLFLAHPSLTNFGIKTNPGATGYACKKFVTENYTGDAVSSGDDFVYLRYTEVLLGYLESKLEAGDVINQALLDQTINKVRARAEVNMPKVTETNQSKLRDIVRRERRVEFCFEPFTRWMDIHRWGIASQVINKKFYGMKLTNDPAHYTAYPVDVTGHLFSIDKTGFYVSPLHDLWPIPQTEIDINPAMEQNPGY